MHKAVLAAALLLLTVLAPVTGAGADYPEKAPGKQKVKDWTFIVYLDADNNLEPYGVQDINEMETAGSTDAVNIVVLFDRAEGYDTTNGDWTGTKLFYVTKDNDTAVIGSKELADMGEVNMGDPKTLANFTAWAVQNYPAKHYLLDLWDHGGGVFGGNWDDTDGDYLDMPDFATALSDIKSRIGRNLDIVGFDECLMGGIEVMYEVYRYADIGIGSEPTEPGEGWPYDRILGALTARPAMTPEEMATQVVNDYLDSYTDGQDNPGDTAAVTQSAFNLSRFDNLLDKFNQFNARLALNAGKYNALIRTARANTQGFDPGHIVFLDITNYPMYDLYDLAYNIIHPGAGIVLPVVIDAGLKESAEALMKAVGETVIAHRAGTKYPDSHGLTIYFPSGNNSLDLFTPKTQFDARYMGSSFARDLYWDEFLSFYFVAQNAPSTPPSVSIVQPKRETSVRPGAPVTVTGAAFDTGTVAKVMVKIDGGEWMQANGTADWSFRWSTAGLKKGRHTVYAKAVDSDGDESALAQVSVVAAPPPQKVSAPPQASPWLLAAAGALLLGAAVLIVRKGRRAGANGT